VNTSASTNCTTTQIPISTDTTPKSKPALAPTFTGTDIDTNTTETNAETNAKNLPPECENVNRLLDFSNRPRPQLCRPEQVAPEDFRRLLPWLISIATQAPRPKFDVVSTTMCDPGVGTLDNQPFRTNHEKEGYNGIDHSLAR
jgi:hypothetical protein